MPVQLVVANAVITGANFNPSVFSHLWLVDNSIIGRQDLASGSVFTDVLVQARTAAFVLNVFPQQVQLVPIAPATASAQLMRDPMEKIVRLLPHTPLTAVGLNFVWQSSLLAQPGPTGRSLFFHRGPLYDAFNAEDARFGAYMSRDVGAVRMRLDVRPLYAQPYQQQMGELLQFAFNFERMLGTIPSSLRSNAVVETLEGWENYRNRANDIVDAAVGGLE
jgi:hypothetical protein